MAPTRPSRPIEAGPSSETGRFYPGERPTGPPEARGGRLVGGGLRALDLPALREALARLEGDGSEGPEARTADGTDLHSAHGAGGLDPGALDLEDLQASLRGLRALAQRDPGQAERLLEAHPRFARALRGAIRAQPASSPWS